MPHPGKPDKIDRRTISLLGGFCFLLSALEYMIPRPVPFFRLGLSNIPLLLALDIMPFSSFMLLGAIKVIGQALISGTLFSYVFLFSLGGTGVSIFFMYILRRGLGKERISLLGVSTAGALTSNGAQLVLAYFFVFGSSIRYAAVPILTLGVVTGMILGLGCEYFIRRSRWYASRVLSADTSTEIHTEIHTEIIAETAAGNNGKPEKIEKPEAKRKTVSGMERFRKSRESFCLKNFSSFELAIAGLCMMPALLLNPDTYMRIIQFAIFYAIAWLSGKRNNVLLTFLVILGIVVFNLLVPYGELLFSIGPLKVTQGALLAGIGRAVTLEGLVMLSRSCVRRDLRFPGVFGEIVGESFRVFAMAAEEKHLFTRKNWAERLDGLLISYGTDRAGSDKEAVNGTAPSPLQGRNRVSKIILVSAVILAWLPLLIRVCLRL